MTPQRSSLSPHRIPCVLLACALIGLFPGTAAAQVLSLDDTRALAREAAFEVETVEAQLGVLDAQRREAAATLRPRVQVIGQFEQRDRQVELDLPDVPGLDVGTPVVMPGNQVRSILDVDAPIVNLDGWERVRAARIQVQSGEAQFDAVSDAVELAAIQLHLQIVALDANIAVAEERRSLAESQIGTLNDRLRVGYATAFEVRRAETRVLEAELETESARRARDEALRMLSVLLGGAELEGVAAAPPAARPGAPVAELVETALNTRTDIDAIELGLDALDASARAERLGLVPDLVFSGQAMATTAEAIDGEQSQWFVQASLVWVPYNRGLRRAREERAAAEADRQRVVLDQRHAEVRAQVLNAEDALRSAEARLQLAVELELLADEALRLAEEAQQAGSATALDVQEAQTALLEARTSRIAAEQGREAAIWELRWATGQL